MEHGTISYQGDHVAYEQTSAFYKGFLKNLAEKGEEPDEEGDTPGPDVADKSIVDRKLSIADKVSNKQTDRHGE